MKQHGENVLFDEEIAKAVKSKGAMVESIGNSNEEEMSKDEPKMSHTEGLKAVESAIPYIEQHEASARDISFLRRLHDNAAHNRAKCERQMKINFFQSKLCDLFIFLFVFIV